MDSTDPHQCVLACLCLILIAGGIPLGLVGGSSPEGGSDLSRGPPPRGALYVINGNADLLSKASANGWTGTGTEGDPVTIEGLSITNSDIIFSISNTDYHILIANSTFIITETTTDAIKISTCKNIDLRDDHFNIRRRAINADRTSYLTLERCNFEKGDATLSIVDNVTIKRNVFSTDSDLRIYDSKYIDILYSTSGNVQLNNDERIEFSHNDGSYATISRSLRMNLFDNDLTGLMLDDADYLTAIDNRIDARDLQIFGCDKNLFKDNNISGTRYLIPIGYSNDMSFYNNSLHACAFNFDNMNCSTMILSPNNTIDGRPIVFAKKTETPPDYPSCGQVILYQFESLLISDVKITDSLLPLTLLDCTGVTMDNVTFVNNVIGLKSYGSEGIVLSSSTVRSENSCLMFDESVYLTLEKNHFEGTISIPHTDHLKMIGNDFDKTIDAIWSEHSDHGLIYDNRFGNCTLEITHCSDFRIENNDIDFIDILASSDTAIIGNTIEGEISIRDSDHMTLLHNEVEQGPAELSTIDGVNLYSNLFRKYGLIYSSDVINAVIPVNNTVGDRPIVYLRDRIDSTVNSSFSFGQLILQDTKRTSLEDLTICDSFRPVQIFTSTDLTIRNVLFSNCTEAIIIEESDRATITDSTFVQNKGFGVFFTAAEEKIINVRDSVFSGSDSGLSMRMAWKGQVAKCVFDGNWNGLVAYDSYQMKICENSFISNTNIGLSLSRGSKGSVYGNVYWSNNRGLSASDGKDFTIKSELFIKNRDEAIYLNDCSNFGIYDSCFVRNNGVSSTYGGMGQVQDRDPNTNKWSENYWSEMTGPDENGDGFFDLPYNFSGSSDPKPRISSPVPIVPEPENLTGNYSTGVLELRWESPKGCRLPFELSYEVIKVVGPKKPETIGITETNSLCDDESDPMAGTSYFVKAFYEDMESNLSNEFYFNLEKILPIIDPITPRNGSFFNVDHVNVSWRSRDDQSGIVNTTVSFDGGGWIGVLGNYYNLTGLTQGVHSFSVRVIDRCLNFAQSNTTFTVDLTDPEIAYPMNGCVLYSNNSVFCLTPVLFDEYGIDRCEVDIDHQGYLEADMNIFVDALTEGRHEFSVKAVDLAGNQREVSGEVVADFTVPALNIITPNPEAFYIRSDVEVKWECYDLLSGVKEICLLLDDEPINVTNRDTFKLTELKNGKHKVKLIATDNCLNRVVKEFTLKIGEGPFVMDYSPSGDEVEPESALWVTLNKDIASIDFLVEGANGEVKIEGCKATFTPFIRLHPLTRYDVEVTGVDREGFDFGPHIWSFTTSGMARIRGAVNDKNGQKLEGVEILDDRSLIGYTDKGDFDFALEPGRHTIKFFKQGYLGQEFDVELTPGEVKDLMITMEQVESDPINEPNKSPILVFVIVAVTIVLIILLTVIVVILVRKKDGSIIAPKEKENKITIEVQATPKQSLYGNVIDISSIEQQLLPQEE